MSLLRLAIRMIFGIDIDIGYAGRSPRVVGGGLPRTIEQFHVSEFVERNAPPVSGRAGRLQPAFALSAELIAKRPQLPVFVPPQAMRAEQARESAIESRDGPSARHGCADNIVNMILPPRAARS